MIFHHHSFVCLLFRNYLLLFCWQVFVSPSRFFFFGRASVSQPVNKDPPIELSTCQSPFLYVPVWKWLVFCWWWNFPLKNCCCFLDYVNKQWWQTSCIALPQQKFLIKYYPSVFCIVLVLLSLSDQHAWEKSILEVIWFTKSNCTKLNIKADQNKGK